MKTIFGGVLLISISSFGVASGQSLPPGSYNINGTVTSMAGSSCPLTPKFPATGVLYYPGPGKDTTQIALQSVAPQKTVTVALMSAFPAVPADGLNGWSASNPVSPNYSQYRNGTLTGGGTAAILSFDLGQMNSGPLASAQGTLTINVDSIAPCKETLQLILEKVAPFSKLAE